MINICYLSHNRPENFGITYDYLSRIKLENKNKIRLHILSTQDFDWNSKIKNDFGIEVFIEKFENKPLNYIDKINSCVNSGFEYSIKLDEDCFINNHVIDFIVENIDILKDERNLLISPVMSNNIPSCDDFIEDFIEDKEIKDKVESELISQNMPNGLWGVDYSHLNEFTVMAKKWNKNSFYHSVKNMNTKTKGIHPLRICYNAQILVNDYILKNLEKFETKRDCSFYEIDAPYFTNSLFAIKTNFWKEIFNNSVDGYDEIALNEYKKNSDKNVLFIKNGFAIHTMFNTVHGNKNPWGIGSEKAPQDERDFCEKILLYLKQKNDTLYRR